MYSPQVLVGCTSGASPRRPMSWMRAICCADCVVLKARMALGACAARRIIKEDMFGMAGVENYVESSGVRDSGGGNGSGSTTRDRDSIGKRGSSRDSYPGGVL